MAGARVCVREGLLDVNPVLSSSLQTPLNIEHSKQDQMCSRTRCCTWNIYLRQINCQHVVAVNSEQMVIVVTNIYLGSNCISQKDLRLFKQTFCPDRSDSDTVRYLVSPGSFSREGHLRLARVASSKWAASHLVLELRRFVGDVMELADILWREHGAVQMSHLCCQITGNRDGHGGLCQCVCDSELVPSYPGILPTWHRTNKGTGAICHTHKSCLIKKRAAASGHRSRWFCSAKQKVSGTVLLCFFLWEVLSVSQISGNVSH